jgi:hypothetical protein
VHTRILYAVAIVALSAACRSTRPAGDAVTTLPAPAECKETAGMKPEYAARGTIHLKKQGPGCGLVKGDVSHVVVWDGGTIAWDVTNDCGVDVRMKLLDKDGLELDHCGHETTIKPAGGQLTCTVKKKQRARCVAYGVEWESSLGNGALDPVIDIRR